MIELNEQERKVLRLVKMVAIGVATLILLVVVISNQPLRTVPTGSRGVVTVGGAIRGIEQEGFMLLWPWQRLTLFNIRAETADIKGAEGATSDTQPVHVNLTVRYSIGVDKVAEVYEKYSHDGNLDSYVQTATAEVFKAVTARYSAPDLIAKRQDVSDNVLAALNRSIAVYGAKVIKVDMTNFSFSGEYMKAISDKVQQDQFLQTAIKKQHTLEAEERQKVIVAEAAASAVKATADGQAYAVREVAKANAEALHIQNAALSQSKDVLELRRIEVEMEKARRWKGDLPQAVYSGAPIPFLNVTK
jgi:prohibitin 2